MKKIWEERTLGGQFEAAVKRYQDKTAISDGNQTYSYEQLLEMAVLDRQNLKSAGVLSHEVVILQMSNGIQFVSMFLALMMSEIVPIMMLPNHGHREFSGIQSRIHCRYHITDQGIIHLDGMNSPAYIEPLDTVEAQTMDERIALLLLSGGTTGIPKLIPRTHGDYYYSCMKTAEKSHWDENTVFLTPLPLGHNFALAHPGILGALFSGGKVIVMKYASPMDMIELIEQERVTSVILVPALLHLLIEVKALLSEADIHTLRQIFVGGAMLPIADARKTAEVFGNVLIQVFGTAEGLICTTAQDDPEEKIITTQGKPISELDELKIVDGNGRELPQGQRGELITRGPYTIHSYYRTEDPNNQYFTPDGWYRTGDLVSIDEEGFLTVHGRIKERINRAGEKIIPSYLEGILTEWGAFSEVAVIGVPDEVLTERICICGKPVNPKNHLSLCQINDYLKKSGVSGFCLGDEYLEASVWPLTAVGKTDKKRLAEMEKESRA